ncbi:hypothetical protein D8S78_10080 [Natrialba swarupiae]|nr:hypothetical protein [Natrialba swarupiae]
MIAEEETRAEDDVASGWDGEIAGRLAALAALATVGHWIAIVVGTALFLVVDTPIRFVLYWVGYGDLFTFTVVTFGPFAGIGIGALVAWIVPGIAVAEIGRGVRVTDAFRTAMAAPSSARGRSRRRRAGRLRSSDFRPARSPSPTAWCAGSRTPSSRSARSTPRSFRSPSASRSSSPVARCGSRERSASCSIGSRTRACRPARRHGTPLPSPFRWLVSRSSSCS